MFTSKLLTTINSTSNFLKNGTISNKNRKKFKLKSIMSFDKCLKLGKIARNVFKFKTISKKAKRNNDENTSITNMSLWDNSDRRISSNNIPIYKNCNYDLLILNSSCNCQNNSEIFNCDHDFKPFFNNNENNQIYLNRNNNNILDYEFMDSFTQQTSNIVLNSSIISISSSESEESDCCCCKSNTHSQEILESDYYLDFENKFRNNHSKNTEKKHILNESIPSLLVSNSISFSSYNSESSLDSLLSKMNINNVSYNKKKDCCCFNLSKNEENQYDSENMDSDYEDELDIEINHCLMIIKEINLIKLNQDDDNLLSRIYVCITEYKPILDDDLPVGFTEPVTVLKNYNETEDWLYVQSVKTGQRGYIPRYIAMDVDVFLQQVIDYCNKLISSRKKFTI
jgi:hypothetical protein